VQLRLSLFVFNYCSLPLGALPNTTRYNNLREIRTVYSGGLVNGKVWSMRRIVDEHNVD
jgi:hypothetical protein